MIDYKKSLALNIYRRLTGDMETQFDNTEDIWTEIDRELAGNDGTVNIEELDVRYTSNGEYVFESTDEVTAYAPVKIEVDCPVGYDLTVFGVNKELSDKFNEAVQHFIGNSVKYKDSGYWDSDKGGILPFKPVSDTVDYPQGMGKSVFINNYSSNRAGSWSPYLYELPTLMVVGEVNLPNITTLSNLFYLDRQLYYVGSIYAPLCTSLYRAFGECVSLKHLPTIYAPLVEDISYLCFDCHSLLSIPEIDCSNVKNVSQLFSSDNRTLTDVGGFINLGMQPDLSGSNKMFPYMYNITHESLMNIINGLYDRAAAGYSMLTIKLGLPSLEKLSDEEKAIATNKGWTLS